MVEQETIQPEYVRIGIAGDDAAQKILMKKYFDDFRFSEDQEAFYGRERARFTLNDGKIIFADFFIISGNLFQNNCMDYVDAVVFVCDLRDEDPLRVVESQLNEYFSQRSRADDAYLTIFALDAENEKETKKGREKVFKLAGKWNIGLGISKESRIKEEVNTAIKNAYEHYCNHRKLEVIAFKEHRQNRKKKDNFCSNCQC